MIESILHALWNVHDLVVLAVVFALPALEASTLIGVFLPGESTILLGGVLAAYGKVPLW